MGHDDKTVASALAIIVRHQAASKPQTVAAPFWDGDSLVLSDPDLMPPGYGDRTGAELGELFPIAADNPKLALIVGLSFGAPYIEPLQRQPFWCHITGDPRQGKSTGLETAASLWGKPRPRGVILPWNTTTNGLTAALGELSVLPVFLDDLHAAGMTPSQIRKLIFSTVEGNSRLRSTRGGRRKDSAPWYGVLFSTGNDSILGMLPQPEVAARVVEIASPVVSTSQASKWVKSWARSNYGTFRSVPIVTMRAAVDQAEELLRGEIDGGTEETIMENLALGVAGAAILGGAPLAEAALYAAREILAALKAELKEAGVSAGERLLEALRQTLAARPGAFPSRTEYEAALTASDRPMPTVEGFWEEPMVYVITSKLAAIAAAYGLTDTRVGLRDLKQMSPPRLISQATQHRRQIRAAGRRVDVYAVLLETDGENSPENVPPTSDTSDTSVIPGQTAWNPSLVPAQPVTSPVTRPVTPAVPAASSQVNGGVTGPALDSDGRVATGARSGPPAAGVTGSAVTRPRRPLRSVSNSAPEEDAEEWRQFSGLILEQWPEATPEEILAALRTFQTATGGLRHIGTSAIAGQLLFHKLQAQHGSIPELERGGLPGLEEMNVARIFNYVDTGAHVERHGWVMGADVNAQFLAVCRSIELGTGEAEQVAGLRFTDLREAKAHFKHPGYVQLAEDHAIGRAGVLEAGTWIAHPTAAYLAERGHLVVEPVGYVWWEHRRWLQAWGKTVSTARDVLAARPDLPSRMALHAVKLMYAAFLGGYLRSEQFNRGLTKRPDWSDQLLSLARVNMLRALDKCQPSAFATHADMAYFLLDDNQTVKGLTISPQAGKWKVGKIGRTDRPATIIRGGEPIRTTLAEQVAAGSVAGVRDVVSDLDHQHRGVDAA
ncbi:DUF927 domain-containing protein [Planomonospora sp. ID82291]|uniref:DUF927 domain-containing protein n=1 Tax=Planomonospora sp. ID82291 TaxID=2738136 RepID=UPI0018C3B9D8|nr:DUF927 domain-containing protein [Planomonospora sp. ID82291]MBG0819127.1 DUF927 domain-containing protein [Planomonospora sp. ID82291]